MIKFPRHPDVLNFMIAIPFFSFQLTLFSFNAYSLIYYYFRYDLRIYKWTINGDLGKSLKKMNSECVSDTFYEQYNP